jgi:hypothetical protein
MYSFITFVVVAVVCLFDMITATDAVLRVDLKRNEEWNEIK